jgi:hypothetical protein
MYSYFLLMKYVSTSGTIAKKIIISLLLELCFRMACNLVRERAVPLCLC